MVLRPNPGKPRRMGDWDAFTSKPEPRRRQSRRLDVRFRKITDPLVANGELPDDADSPIEPDYGPGTGCRAAIGFNVAPPRSSGSCARRVPSDASGLVLRDQLPTSFEHVDVSCNVAGRRVEVAVSRRRGGTHNNTHRLDADHKDIVGDRATPCGVLPRERRSMSAKSNLLVRRGRPSAQA